jgi:hypothetical protein
VKRDRKPSLHTKLLSTESSRALRTILRHARLLQSGLRASRARPAVALRGLLLASLTMLGCRCSSLAGEHAGQHFTRCAQVDPPAARAGRVGPLQLRVEARVLTIEAALPLRIAAFAGPVGALLERRDLELLRRARPGLVLYLGGLGDSPAIAHKNLTNLAALHVPTLFVAGGEDRWPVVESAFAALSDAEREYVLSASGLREVRIGMDRLVVVAGSAFGRYALDEQGCGFGADDLEDIQAAASEYEGSARTWLLSWQAPAGHGVSEGRAGTELGSPDLRAMATALLAKGGLFAYPEVQAGRARTSPLALVLPRLGSLGSQRADGSRLPPQVAVLILDTAGLVPSP